MGRTLVIDFTDGTTETIKTVDAVSSRDGVLSAYRDRPYSGGREHLGAWPLCNIKRWLETEDY